MADQSVQSVARFLKPKNSANLQYTPTAGYHPQLGGPMRSRPHNALHLDVSHSGTSTLTQCDGGATGVPLPISYQISSSRLQIGGR